MAMISEQELFGIVKIYLWPISKLCSVFDRFGLFVQISTNIISTTKYIRNSHRNKS